MMPGSGVFRPSCPLLQLCYLTLGPSKDESRVHRHGCCCRSPPLGGSLFDQLLQCAWRKLALSTAALKKTDQSTGEVGPVWRNNQESSTFQSLTPRRNLCTFRLYFQVIFLFVYKSCIHAWAEKFLKYINKSLFTVSLSLDFYPTTLRFSCFHAPIPEKCEAFSVILRTENHFREGFHQILLPWVEFWMMCGVCYCVGLLSVGCGTRRLDRRGKPFRPSLPFMSDSRSWVLVTAGMRLQISWN